MNRAWEDFLHPDTEKYHNTAGSTELGGLSQGFRSDFLLRGYKVQDQLTGKISFIQGLFLALTGRVPDCAEDRLLNSMFINNGLVDSRFWLFRTARLAATVKSSPTASLAAGLLVNDGTLLGSGAAYHASTFFYETQKNIQNKQAELRNIVQENLQQGKIISGYGRVLARGPDERNGVLLEIARQCDLADGTYLKQAFAIEKLLQELKSDELYMNSAGLICSLLLDMGMLPRQIMIFFSLLFLIGISGNVGEAYERPPGEFSELTDDDIEYTGPKRKKIPLNSGPQQRVVDEKNTFRIVVMDSVSFLTRKNNNDIVVCGSHGGVPAAQYAARYFPRAIVFNDAGRGKENAGIAGLSVLDEAGLPALTVSADSARIGDGMDVYQNGIVSSVNKKAAEFGIIQNMTISNVINALTK